MSALSGVSCASCLSVFFLWEGGRGAVVKGMLFFGQSMVSFLGRVGVLDVFGCGHVVKIGVLGFCRYC